MSGSEIVVLTIDQVRSLVGDCINEALNGLANNKATGTQKEPEEYLTPQEMADTLHVSLVTLWHWDNKGITKPLRIGNQKRYRRSDIEKFMQKEERQ
jgi:predicted DNA-binding transcriptional regulator AlpA